MCRISPPAGGDHQTPKIAECAADAVTGISGEIHTHGRVKRLGGFHQRQIGSRLHLVVFAWQQAIHSFGNALAIGK